MFTTYRSAEVEFSCMGDPRYSGTQIWRYVEQELMCPWFYVQVLRPGSTDTDLSMLMLPCAKDIAAMVDCETPNWCIQQVQIVTPARMNGTDRWQMEPLRRITLLESPALASVCECFEVTSGRLYTSGGPRVLEGATLLQVLFDAAVHLKKTQ